MAGKRPTKLPDGTWTYPNSAAVLDEVGLKTIAHYIGVRRQHIASYFVDKPIFQTCMDGVRRRGSGVRNFGGHNQWIWRRHGRHALRGLLSATMTERSKRLQDGTLQVFYLVSLVEL